MKVRLWARGLIEASTSIVILLFAFWFMTRDANIWVAGLILTSAQCVLAILYPSLFAAPSANSESPLPREAKFALAYGIALLVLFIFGKNLPLEKGAASALLAWVILILLKITQDIARIGRWRVIMGVAVVLVMLTVSVLLFTGLKVSVGSKDLLTILTSSAVSFAMNILLSFASVRSANAEGSDDDRLGARVHEPASPLGMILPRARPRRRSTHSPRHDA